MKWFWQACAFSLAITILVAQDREIPIDNDFVRVVVVHRAEPGVKTKPHRHEANRVMIYLNAGGQNINWSGGRMEKLSWKAGQVLWSAKGGMHVAEITGTEPARIVEVELKREASKLLIAPAKRDPLAVDPKHHTLEFENAQVRVVRLRLGPGEQTPVLEHSMVRLMTYLTPFDLETGGPAKRLQGRSGRVEWLKPGTETLRNLSPETLEAIAIYLKF